MRLIDMIKLDIKILVIQKPKDEALKDILSLRNFLSMIEDTLEDGGIEDGNEETDSKN